MAISAGLDDLAARAWRNGRRSGFKIRRRNTCRFESDRPHHRSPEVIKVARRGSRASSTAFAASCDSLLARRMRLKQVKLAPKVAAGPIVGEGVVDWIAGLRRRAKARADEKRALRAEAEALLAGSTRIAALLELDARAAVAEDVSARRRIEALRMFVYDLAPRPPRSDTATRMLYRDRRHS